MEKLVDLELEIMDSNIEFLKTLLRIIKPENDKTISTEIDDKKIKIRITSVKASSIYSLTDEILKSYEILKRINDYS